jgi:hypothetical protein
MAQDKPRLDLLQGTLDLLILRALRAGAMHGWAVSERIQQISPQDPKRDVFEFADGRQITVSNLPSGLIFDVLVVPGSEQLSAILDIERAAEDKEDEKEREKPLLVRLLAHF